MALTLKQYAQEKRLPLAFLRKLAIGDVHMSSGPAVRIPYMDSRGTVLATRMRVSIDGDKRFIWKTGSKLFPYGLGRLKKVKLARHLRCRRGKRLPHAMATRVPGARLARR